MLLLSTSTQAKDTADLKVFSSSNKASNAVNSFIVTPVNSLIPEGIKQNSSQNTLALQTPFVIELKQAPADNEIVRWKIVVTKKTYGGIELLSKFKGTRKTTLQGYSWQSELLDTSSIDRHQLVFRPKPKKHQPQVYKKGKGRGGKRRKYGGGSQTIDDQFFNPRLSYHVFVDLLKAGQLQRRHQALLEMDNIDMIRQEYINHYNIRRYGRGENGKLPVPKREEVTTLPVKSPKLIGNPITESQYKLLINDGIDELAIQVADIYQQQKQYFKHTPLKDINNKPLPVPDKQLWLSGGWRNPERNEWYSNATNGIHQRGGAIDIIINVAPYTKQSAIAYWVLWQGLEKNKTKLNAFWQLETNGRPMRTREFTEDIEPENGLPDAFDKADHLHINVKYPEK